MSSPFPVPLFAPRAHLPYQKMREMHTLTTPRRVEEIQLSNGGLTRALTAPARDPRPGFCVGRADDVNSVAATGCPLASPAASPATSRPSLAPLVSTRPFRDSENGTRRDVSYHRYGLESIPHRPSNQHPTAADPRRRDTDPSAQPRYHGISPRSLDLPVACARPSDRNSIDCARLRCPRALFVRSPPTIRTLPLLDPSASKSNIESGGPGSRDFRDRFLGLRGNFAARHAKSTPEIFNSVSQRALHFNPSVVFALFFHLDSRSGAWPTGLASRRGRRARQGEEGIVAGFDPFAIPPTPAPHDDTVSTLVPNVPAHPGRVSFSAVLSWLAACLELWEHA